MKKSRNPRTGRGRNSPDDYAVGPGRPPREHQFQPGRSGNPKGRPKRPGLSAKEMLGMLMAEITKPIVVTQGDRKNSMSVLQTGFAQLAMRVAKGDRRGLLDVLVIAEKIGLDVSPQEHAGSPGEISPNRQALLDDYLARHGAIPRAPGEERVIAPSDLADDDVDPDEDSSS